MGKIVYAIETGCDDFSSLNARDVRDMDGDKNRSRNIEFKALIQYFEDRKLPGHKHYSPFLGARLLVIGHRKTLMGQLHDAFKPYNVNLYDNMKDFSQETRLIVCINSLWKLENEEYDLVIIDETKQVLLTMCKLDKKGEVGSPSDVYRKLKSIVKGLGELSPWQPTVVLSVKHFSMCAD